MRKYIKNVYALSAPELYVEIISSPNTQEEMKDKVKLFLEAGAKEVWIMTESGQVTYYNHDGQQIKSNFDIDLRKLI